MGSIRPTSKSATGFIISLKFGFSKLISRGSDGLRSRSDLFVDLGDCFSKFVLPFLTTTQSGPLGSEFSGATEVHYYLQSQKDYLVATLLYCFMLLSPFCVLHSGCLVYSIESQEIPIVI